MKTICLKTVGVIITLFLLVGCGGSDEEPISKQPTLTSISPTSGPRTAIVTITGSNFRANVATIEVFFNGKKGEVQSVTDTEIVAKVPSKAFTGKVTIKVNDLDLEGPVFTYIVTDVQVTTLAGSTDGFADDTGTNAQFSFPAGVAIDTQGSIYVADLGNHKIRKITSSGVVTTLAGTIQGFNDGSGTSAQFNYPSRVAVDVFGNVYVADRDNHKIRKITSSGVVTTLAGSTQGYNDGPGASAQFDSPNDVAVDASGNVYVADSNNHKIRKITPDGEVTTLAGSTVGFNDGTSANAQFDFPAGVALDDSENVYVVDFRNHRIRKIAPDGSVTTLAGSTAGFNDSTGANAQFNLPSDVAVDAFGNVYVTGTENHKIRKITPDGEVTTLAGSTVGFNNGTGASAQFNLPNSVTVDALGTVYVADLLNHKIRKITQE